MWQYVFRATIRKWVVILHTHVDGAAPVRCNEHLLVEVPRRCIHTDVADANRDLGGAAARRSPDSRHNQYERVLFRAPTFSLDFIGLG